MRVLFSTTAGAGHFGPLVPFAKACQAAGHEVLVAAPESFAPAVAAAGFAHAAFDDVPSDVMGAVFARLPSLSREEANDVVIGHVFGRLDAQAALPGVSATVEEWRPDVVVREPTEFASWVVAERAGVPQVVVAIGVAEMDEEARPALLEPLAELRAIAGLDEDPELAGLAALPSFSMVPPTFDGSDAGPVRRFSTPIAGDSQGRLPAPWGDPDLPLVYVSFGSVTGTLPPFAPLYGAVVGALSDLPVRVLLTVGEGDLPAADQLPRNVHVERWWPQADVMPLAAAVVGHGGFGTTITALAAGVPQVVVPLFSMDQFINAARVAEAGVGVCLDGGVEGVAGLGDALARVLGEPAFGESARRMAAEIAGLPDVAQAVPILEELATRGRLSWLGSARGTGEILGDLVPPAGEPG